MIINAGEAIVAYYIFRTMIGLNWDTFSATATAAIVGLSSGAVLMGGIIVLSGVNGSALPRADLAVAVAGLVGINVGVAVIEGLLTGFVVQFLTSVRPELIGGNHSERDEPTGVTA